MANPGSYTSAGITPPASTSAPAPTAAVPVSQGTFPQTSQGSGLGVNGIAVANISVADFLANYNISSTEQSTYIQQGPKGPELNQNALFLMQYKAMDPIERENYQQALVNAGLITQNYANGINNPIALGGFKTAIANAGSTGIQVDQYLQQYTGTNNANLALAQATANARQQAQVPVTATVENPTTLAATITNAFDQALGYAPSQDQVQSFISQMQGQEVGNAQAPHEAAKSQLAYLKSQESAISKLGPEGLDAIIDAYTSAIHGINPAAGSGQQGPATGTALAPGAQNPNPSGSLNGPVGMTAQPVTAGHGAALVSDLAPQNWAGVGGALTSLSMGHIQPTQIHANDQTGAFTEVGGKPNQVPQPSPVSGTPGTVPTYGGFYAMTPADWTQAQKLNPQLAAQVKKNGWSSPGQAPVNIQHAAFSQLLQTTYDNNGGSWADAIISIAGGDSGTSKKPGVLGSNINLKTFATSIANQVNDQIEALTNQINTHNVTVKTTQPDAAAEANLSTKNADPIGYTASNISSWAGTLSKMLYGAPSTEINGTNDTFTGPVAPPNSQGVAA